MKQNINFNELLSNKNFIPWFLMNNFPEGINKTTDSTLSELIQENFDIETSWVNQLTGYYDEVFEESDGYIENPKSVELKLNEKQKFSVEFHPGDTLYYLDEIQIGSTGPSYTIRTIPFKIFLDCTNNIILNEKLLLLPMIKIKQTEKNDFKMLIKSLLLSVSFQESLIDAVIDCILENCME